MAKSTVATILKNKEAIKVIVVAMDVKKKLNLLATDSVTPTLHKPHPLHHVLLGMVYSFLYTHI